MSEHPGASAPVQDRSERESHALTARAAGMAGRLADVIERRAGAGSGAGEAVDTLRTWARSVPRAGDAVRLLDELARRLDLTDPEVDLVVLAGLPEEHEALAATFRACHPRGEPHPAMSLAALVLERDVPDRAVLRRLLYEGRAARTGLLDVVGDAPFFERSLVLADRVWDALHGHDAWPRSLDRVQVTAPPGGLGAWLELPQVRRAVRALGSPAARTLLITSADAAVTTSRCAAVAAAAGSGVVAARIRAAEPATVRLLAVHAAIRGACPAVVAEVPSDAPAQELDLAGVPGPLMVCAPSGSVRAAPDRPLLPVPVDPVGVTDRRAAWRAALPAAAGQAPELAARHPLDPAVTAQVALDVETRQQLEPGPVDLAEVSATIRARAGVALPVGVDLVSPRAGWGFLVLGTEPSSQLRDAVARLGHQSRVLDDWQMSTAARADRGVRLLFAGPPGTGKSLAAEVMATEAGTDLLVVDVSRVVSKWIGETEKNLAAVFDVAERTQAVLLLDEADALFATRTQISDAKDRYANLETAYLLQRLDRFDGLAVLATNLRQNIDVAFVRRMDYVIEFELPDDGGRLRLWSRHLPAALRGPDVDLRALARLYPVPGAWIRNVALGAAFLAAAAGELVGQRHLVTAMRREYAKASRPFPGEPVRVADSECDVRAARRLAAVAAADGDEEGT